MAASTLFCCYIKCILIGYQVTIDATNRTLHSILVKNSKQPSPGVTS